MDNIVNHLHGYEGLHLCREVCPFVRPLIHLINMTVENNVKKSRKSFNQANQGSDNVAD